MISPMVTSNSSSSKNLALQNAIAQSQKNHPTAWKKIETQKQPVFIEAYQQSDSRIAQDRILATQYGVESLDKQVAIKPIQYQGTYVPGAQFSDAPTNVPIVNKRNIDGSAVAVKKTVLLPAIPPPKPKIVKVQPVQQTEFNPFGYVANSFDEYWQGVNPNSQMNKNKYTDSSGSAEPIDTLDVAMTITPIGGYAVKKVAKEVISSVAKKNLIAKLDITQSTAKKYTYQELKQAQKLLKTQTPYEKRQWYNEKWKESKIENKKSTSGITRDDGMKPLPGGYTTAKTLDTFEELKRIASDKTLSRTNRDNAIRVLEKASKVKNVKLYPVAQGPFEKSVGRFDDAELLKGVVGMGGMGAFGFTVNDAYGYQEKNKSKQKSDMDKMADTAYNFFASRK